MKCSLGISDFLEEMSSLSHSIVFLYFFALITEVGFLISPCCSLEICIQMGVSFLFSFAFHFSSFSAKGTCILMKGLEQRIQHRTGAQVDRIQLRLIQVTRASKGQHHHSLGSGISACSYYPPPGWGPQFWQNPIIYIPWGRTRTVFPC